VLIQSIHPSFPFTVPVLIVGAGACGLSAALAVRDQGLDVLVLERDDRPSGNTALSSGMIPACGTRFQRAKHVLDNAKIMVADIQSKNKGLADRDLVFKVASMSGSTVEWLADSHGVPIELVDGFLYPGHSRVRMHAPPGRTGGELMVALLRAVRDKAVDLMTSARVSNLLANADGRVVGVRVERPNSETEDIGCATLILACNGFGGNRQMVRKYIPEVADATYFGHAGNMGDAILWGTQLGAALGDMDAYQGHGSIAVPHGILITWALMMEGGIQVNAAGKRFSNEHEGYSEQAVAVLQQPGQLAWDIYDERIHELGMQFEDYRVANGGGAILKARSVEELVNLTNLPADALSETLSHCEKMARNRASDSFGRDFSTKPTLHPPYHAVRVSGALFHTQGGLNVDLEARVLRTNGTRLPNLFAAGGAARGLSGPGAAGYLSGNGLLSAVVLGRIAGQSAAALAGE
jgi:fumarate reductase flavoprotein subunit